MCNLILPDVRQSASGCQFRDSRTNHYSFHAKPFLERMTVVLNLLIQSVPDRNDHGLRAIRHLQFVQNRAHMVSHRPL
jgi:hypothetical protein